MRQCEGFVHAFVEQILLSLFRQIWPALSTGPETQATETEPLPKQGTAQQIADYLTHGYYHEDGDTPYFFSPRDGNPITVDLSGLTADGKQLARWAMDAWEGVVNVDFEEVSSSAELTFDDNRSGANTAVQYNEKGVISSAHINVSKDWIDEYGSALDSYSFRTYLHEIGHVLGMGHAGDYNTSADFDRDAVFTNDSWQLSIMSYFGQDENPNIKATRAVNVTPMEADLLAVRSIYGESEKNPTDGDTVWGVNSNLDNYLGEMFRAMEPRDEALFRNYAFTLYLEDKGGHDLVDFSYDSRDQTIRLAPGSVSHAMGQTGNILIAKGTVIEDYASANGADVIIGNSADNQIWANGNDDRLAGRRGNDMLDGGKGADKLFGGSGNDSLYGQEFNDLLKGGSGADLLFGGTGNDRLVGNNGNDTLEGGDAHDKLFGGKGDDELDGGDGADMLKGASGNDNLFGGGGNDVLRGGSGRDVLEGGDQADRLFGGGGDDVLMGGLAGDLLDGGRGHDILDGGENGDKLFGRGGSDVLLGGVGYDTLNGGAGRDWLEGGTENDVLTGGRGRDTFVFSGGSDRITDFQSGIDTIEIDAAALGLSGASLADVLDLAREIDGGLRFNFDVGLRLTLDGVDRIEAVANDLVIV